MGNRRGIGRKKSSRRRSRLDCSVKNRSAVKNLREIKTQAEGHPLRFNREDRVPCRR